MGAIADTLPPAIQAFAVDAAAYVAGIDEMVADNAKLSESITVTTGELKAMEETAAQAAEASAAAMTRARDARGRFVSGGAPAGTEAAVGEQEALTEAERQAAEAARLEAEMAADLDTHMKLLRDSSLASADAQRALAAANRAATTSIIGVADAQKTAITRSAEEEAAASKLAATQKDLVSGIGKVGTATVVAGGAFLAYGVDAASKYQAQIVKLGTSAGETGSVINGRLTGNLKTASDEILKMSTSTATSTSQLTAGMYQVESAGYHIQAGSNHAADGLHVLQVAAQGARAEQAPLADVTNALTTVMRDFNVPAADAARVMNTMTVAVGQGKMTMADFSSSIGMVSPLAQQAGLSFGEISGSMATLTQHGATARDAVNDLTAVIRGMESPNLQAVKEMDRLGLSATDVSKNLGSRGLVGTLQMYTQAIASHMQGGQVLIAALNNSKTAATNAQVAFKQLPPDVQKMAQSFINGSISAKDWAKYIQGLPPLTANLASQFATAEKRASGFSDLLKSGSPLAQSYMQALSKMTGGTNAMRAALQLTGQNLAETKDNIAATTAAWNKGGKDVKGFADAQQTMAFKVDQAKASFHAMAITIGNELLPPLISVMNFLASHQDVAKGILAVAAAFLAMAVAVKAVLVVQKFMEIVRVIKEWEIATKLLAAAQWVLDAAMNANPIGLVVIAIAALVAGFLYLWFHVKGFRDFWTSAWHGIVAAAQWAWGSVLKPVFDYIVAGYRLVGAVALWLWHNAIEPAYRGIVAYIHWWWDNAKPIFDRFAAGVHLIADAVLWWWHNVMEPAYAAVGALILAWYNNVVKPAFGLVVAAVHLLADVFTWWWHSIVEPVFNGVKTVISAVATAVVGYIHWWVDTARTVLGWFANLASLFGGWFRGAYNAVVSTVGGLVGFVAGLPGKVVNALAGLYDDMLTVGKNIVIGIWNGLVSMGSWLFNQVSSWISSVIPGPIKHVLGISSPSKLMHTYGQHVGEGLALGIHSKHKRVWDAAAGLAKAAAAGVASSLPTQTFTTVAKLVTDAVPSLQYASSGAGFATAENTHLVTSTVMNAAPQPAASSGAAGGGGLVLNVHVEGSVVTQRDFENSIQRAVLRMNVRNPTNQYSLPAGR